MNSRLKSLLSFLVLIAIVAFGVYWFMNRDVAPSESILSGQNIPPQFPPEIAPTGELVEGFNQDLILDKSVPISLSGKSSVQGKVSRTAVYVSTRTTKDLFDSHLKYLEDNGYTVLEKRFGNQSYIYTQKGGVMINYVSISAPENVTVQITEIK